MARYKRVWFDFTAARYTLFTRSYILGRYGTRTRSRSSARLGACDTALANVPGAPISWVNWTERGIFTRVRLGLVEMSITRAKRVR